MGAAASTAAAGAGAGGPTLGKLLGAALEEGHPESAELFLQNNPALAFHVDADGDTPMHHAARAGSGEAARVLLRTLRASAASNT